MTSLFICPQCHYDWTTEIDYSGAPFTYFEEVPRWQKVRLRGGKLVVDSHCDYGDEGAEAFIVCNRCAHIVKGDDLPALVFEERDEESVDAPEQVVCSRCRQICLAETVHVEGDDDHYIGDECCWTKGVRDVSRA